MADVDDIDENFSGTPRQRQKVAAFFTAARDITNSVPTLRLRLAIRPNTWTALAGGFEALSKVEQYNVDLRWTEADLKKLLARRISGYLGRTGRVSITNEDQLIMTVFESPVHWGNKQRPIHTVLVTLARRRPRWLIELAREAAKQAVRENRRRITLQDLVNCLEAFGKRRIQDTVAEFAAQCAVTNELIQAFAHQPERYTTRDLLSTLERRVKNLIAVRFAGVARDASTMEIAAFLFQVGFLSARRDHGDDDYEHLTYADQPDLLAARTNVDDGVSWEIHPVFRQALQLRDERGRNHRQPPKDRRGR